MATVYPTSAGAWSTRTWNDDSTGAAYGPGTPQAGDTVKANNLAITLDTDITVVALSTRVGTTAAAGGSFTTSGGLRTVNADSHAGTTNCLTLTFDSGSIQNGDSYGSDSTDYTYGTRIQRNCVQNGDSFGANETERNGTSNISGIQNGNSTGGSGSFFGFSYGSVITSGGIQNGNATGGSQPDNYGTDVYAGSWLIGNSIGASSVGARINAGAYHIGNATGGTASGAHGTNLLGGLFYGDATGSATHDASGLSIGNTGGVAIIGTATGNATNRYGVLSTIGSHHVVVITTESGSNPKSLGTGADTTYATIPFADPSLIGGGASESVSFYSV